MLYVHGVEYWELLDESCTVTADVYIRNLKANLETTRPQQHKANFQHDSARPHIARTTKTELMNWAGQFHHTYHIPQTWLSRITTFSLITIIQTCDDIKMALEQFFKGQPLAF
ncbi:unnamed protein product [Haemonchus placei]|uniref:Transposase n=1 Tax=Haemonchus placei TaxID=6290 RepID=A0A0N4WJU5_HAEPC|nr:unnamed protein product [Haemonchus placei]